MAYQTENKLCGMYFISHLEKAFYFEHQHLQGESQAWNMIQTIGLFSNL